MRGIPTAGKMIKKTFVLHMCCNLLNIVADKRHKHLSDSRNHKSIPKEVFIGKE